MATNKQQLEGKLTVVGDAIRSKTGEGSPLTLDEMATEIENIKTETIFQGRYIINSLGGNRSVNVKVTFPNPIVTEEYDVYVIARAYGQMQGDGGIVSSGKTIVGGSAHFTSSQASGVRMSNFTADKTHLSVDVHNVSSNSSAAYVYWVTANLYV